MARADERGWFTLPKWIYSMGERAGTLGDRITKNDSPEKKLERAEKTLSTQIRMFGPDGGPTANARARVATVLERMDRFIEAGFLRDEVLAANRHHLGTEHVRTLMAEMGLAYN